MGRVFIRRTWPCGTQESIELVGIGVGLRGGEDEKGRPCPVHGLHCHKGVQ